DLPEGGLRKDLVPEDAPASDGSPVGAEELGKLGDAPRRGPLTHGRDQDDHGSEVNLAAKESYRRRRHPLAATILITAEAQAVIVLLGELAAPAPRLPRVVGAVQATAVRARLRPRALGKILV